MSLGMTIALVVMIKLGKRYAVSYLLKSIRDRQIVFRQKIDVRV